MMVLCKVDPPFIDLVTFRKRTERSRTTALVGSTTGHNVERFVLSYHRQRRWHIFIVDFETRYPGSRKTLFYKKTRVEKYAPYSTKDGLVLKISEFADYDCKSFARILINRERFLLFHLVKELIYVTQRYEHRQDKLQERENDIRVSTTYEHYLPGRQDHLKGEMKDEHSSRIVPYRRRAHALFRK
jgi:hypothetical protein